MSAHLPGESFRWLQPNLLIAIPYFYLVNTGSFIFATIAEVIGFGFVFGFGYGEIPTFYKTQTIVKLKFLRNSPLDIS